MRAVAETAVRWRAGVTSFHMAPQMAARTVLAGDDLAALNLAAGLVLGLSLSAAGTALLQALDVLVALQRGNSAPLLKCSVKSGQRRAPSAQRGHPRSAQIGGPDWETRTMRQPFWSRWT